MEVQVHPHRRGSDLRDRGLRHVPDVRGDSGGDRRRGRDRNGDYRVLHGPADRLLPGARDGSGAGTPVNRR